MRFKPQSEQEIQAMSLIEAGTYPFEVLEAEDTKSKSGNEMIKVKLKLWDNAGRERVVFDYLLEAMSYKLRHFCEATSLLDKYETGDLQASSLIGRGGKLELETELGKAKPDGSGNYPDKNRVADYVKSDGAVSKPVAKAGEPDFIDDDLPF